MTSWAEDLRYALRVLARRPGFSLSAVAALALGIGFNTMMLSVADVLLYKPLTVPDQDSLVTIQGRTLGREGHRALSGVAVSALLRDARSVEQTAVYQSAQANLSGDGYPELVSIFRVSASFFRAIGLQPIAGRLFLEGEEGAAILQHGLWERRFGADPHIAGRDILINGTAHRVAGVMPKGFRFPVPADVWVPLDLSPRLRAAEDTFRYRLVARLRPGVSLSEARAELATIGAGVARDFPASHAGRTVALDRARDVVSGDLTAQYTNMMLIGAALLLLIACANVANLQLARGAGRAREFALRAALGAGRARLLRLVLIESVVLAAAGAIAGLALAAWGIDLNKSAMPAEVERFLPGWRRLGINPWVLSATALIAFGAGIVSGILPAWLLARGEVSSSLKDGGRGASSGAARGRLRSLLVASEIVVALVLLVGASLMVRGFRSIADPHPNLEADRLLTFRTTLIPAATQVARFQQRVLEQLRALPGVESASLATNLPYTSGAAGAWFEVQGEGRQAKAARRSVQTQSIDGDYFRTLRIPLRAGRTFQAQDGPEAQPVAIVSAAFVREFLRAENSIGRRIRIVAEDTPQPWLTIAGVAGDILHDPTQRSAEPVLYLPYTQSPVRGADFCLRTASGPLRLATAVREAVRGIDPHAAVSNLMTEQTVIDNALAGFGYVAVLMTVLGAVALFLACVGVYSLMAHAVSERTQELGIRIALGAAPASVLWLVLRKGLLMVGVGTAAGLLLAAAFARLISGLVFGVSAYDPVAFILIPAALSLSALLACWVPARRATTTDPITALRYE